MAAIDQFTGAFEDLARPNRFEVFCSELGDTPNLCKASTAPAMTVGPLDANYQGRIIKLSGDRTYADWTVTVYGTNSYAIYRAANQWSDRINNPSANTSVTPSNYKRDATVRQLDRSGGTLYTWQLKKVWPTEVGQIDFDWSQNDAALEFTITFAFDYMEGS